MLPATTTANPSTIDEKSTADASLEAGVLLALKEEEAGRHSPLIDWLALHPQHAPEIAAYLAGSRAFRRSVAPMSESGAAVGGFELREEIGRGAMGVVYRAYDPNLKRDVAVKRVRADAIGSEAEWAHFQFEAEAIASLSHPAIVPVHAYGNEGGSPYLVMPLMEGGSLAQRLRNLGPDRCLPPDEAAKLIRDVACGVHHAHQRGLLHRDLKPGNILLDLESKPHIADFGLARRLDASHSQSASGSIAGTAAYMAPEQARGEKGLTTAADIHALGAILYELLTGEPPFGTGELIPTLKRVLEEHATSVRKKRPDVPKDLEAICMKCLERRPVDRYRSADEFANDLEHFLNGEAVCARPPGFWDWIRQLMRTRPHPNYTWQVPAWQGAIVLVTSVAIYLMVQAESSAASVWAVGLGYAAGIFATFWWYMLRKFRHLPSTERNSLVIGVGHTLGYLGLLAAYLPMSSNALARDVLQVYPALMALSGLGTFTIGATNWSRFFPVGIFLIAMVPILARFPDSSPMIYGVLSAFLLWYWTYAKIAYFAKPRSESA